MVLLLALVVERTVYLSGYPVNRRLDFASIEGFFIVNLKMYPESL